MQTKDYLTLLLSLLALLVSISSFFMTYRKGRKTDVVEAASRKNEILLEYSGVMNLIAENRFYYERWSRLVAEMGAPGMMSDSLEGLNAAETLTKLSIRRVRALDPKDIATEDKARETLEELYGRSQELTARLTGMIDWAKRQENELNEKRNRANPPA